MREQLEKWSQQPGEYTASQQHISGLVAVGASCPRLLERPINASEYHHINQGDSDQEKSRDTRADYPADVLQKLEMVLCSGSGPVCDQSGNDDDCRMSESEVETHRHWSLTVLHQLASNVVYRRNVVSTDSVPKTECVRENPVTACHCFIMKPATRPSPPPN